MGRIEIARGIEIEEDSIEYSFIKAAGPGGRKVNSSSSAVQLFFDLELSGLEDDVVERIRLREKNRINQEGVLVIESKERRSQSSNRQGAWKRLAGIIETSIEPPLERLKSKTPQKAHERRLNEKRKKAEKKQKRKISDDELV